MAAPTTRTLLDHTCYTATAFGTWTARSSMWCDQVVIGTTKVIGPGQFTERYGKTIEGGSISIEAPIDVLGHYVKVTHDPLGTATDVWWGVLQRANITPGAQATDGHGQVTYQAMHILGLLDYYFPARGLDWNPNLSTPTAAQTGALLPFNALPGGDMHTADDATRGVRLHNLSGAGTYWTAYHVIRTILKLYASQFIYPPEGAKNGPIFQLTASTNLTWRVPPFDPAGKSVAEVINYLVNPGRGLAMRIASVSGSAINLEVVNTAAQSITIGSTSLDAATPTALVLDSDSGIKDVRTTKAMAPYESVFGFGARPHYGLTLWYKQGDSNSSLVPDGWSYTATPSDLAGDEDHWHKFKVADGWDGKQYNVADDGIPNNWEPTSILPTGYAAWHGFPPNPEHLELTTDLPASEGWGSSEDGPRHKATVVIGNSTDGWKLIKTAIVCGAGWVRLGTNRLDGYILKSRLASGNNTMLVTVGARGWAPITVGSCGASTTWTREVPANLVMERPDCEYWCMLAGTVKGVDSSKALQTYASDDEVRDDLPELQYAVAQAAAAARSPRGSISWRKPGTIDVTNYKPATLINPVTIHGTTHDLYAIIQSVTLNYSKQNYGTAWEGTPRRPGMRTV